MIKLLDNKIIISLFIVFILTFCFVFLHGGQAIACQTIETDQEVVPIEEEPYHHFEYDNQYLRVFDVIFPPGYRTLPHTHAKDNVAIVINGGLHKIETVGGDPPKKFVNPEVGDALFAYASEQPYTHKITNLDNEILRFKDVEILSSLELSQEDLATENLPGHKIILDNDEMRVYQLKLQPGESTELLNHNFPFLTVAISPGIVEVETPQGKSQPKYFKPGEICWHTDPSKYILKNIGSTSFEKVDIQLK
ncbi:hypothetical protein [Moorena bouillonii]|uniref:Uncharacterized protein n=1 Tax=Moorena bouillonii PNG TaxID=568701 RepID=A0A1U7N3L5_9CYAN|nr:hypothetical protein [Moorena bouillonii]OLT60548.1 hypothetical protein BJP37_17545 [Moorena bouillonii PNG]